jgi:hypothetical protein
VDSSNTNGPLSTKPGQLHPDVENPGAPEPDAQEKTLHAAEQNRPDVAQARTEWREHRPELNPGKLIFLDG